MTTPVLAESPPATASQGRTIAIYATLFFLSFIAYANTLHNQFVLDDKLIIVQNPLIQDLSFIPKLFAEPHWLEGGIHLPNTVVVVPVYRPITLVTFAINYAAGGLDPVGYHLVNIALHGLVVASLYALGMRLGLNSAAAFLSAAIFAVHPLHTEAVTPIIGRAELLMALCTLLSLIWYIDAWTHIRHRARHLVASMAMFSVALLSKEQAMVLPVLLVLYDVYDQSPIRKGWRAYVLRYACYGSILGILLAVRSSLLGLTLYTSGRGIAFLDNPLAALDWMPRLAGALTVTGRYLLLFVWPASLAADYSYDAIPLPAGFWAPAPLFMLLIIVLFLYAAAQSFFRHRRKAFFAIGFSLITFAPASNILVPIGTIMGERLFYLPSAGLCLLIAIATESLVNRYHLGRHRGFAVAGTVVITTVLTIGALRTLLRNRDWSTYDRLILSGIMVVPNNAKNWAGLGAVRIGEGDFPGALKAYEKALRIYPDYSHYPRFAKNFGSVLLTLGRRKEAIAYLTSAVRMQPDYAAAHYNLGYAYLKSREWDKAAQHFKKALDIEPGRSDAKKGLAIAEAERKRSAANRGR